MRTALLPLGLALFASNGALSLSSNSHSRRRRHVLAHFWKATGATVISFGMPYHKEAEAACLPGDLSKECIGVYKIPLEEAQNSRSLNSPEAVQKNAPDVNYVKPIAMPNNVAQAKEMLETQRAAADDIKDIVLAGRLEEAGIKVLNLIPKVTAAGKTIQDQVQERYPMDGSGANQMRVLKFNQQRQELITTWSQIDIEIGQAIRGQMGQSTVAQLELLKEIKEGINVFDEFLLAVDSNTK